MKCNIKIKELPKKCPKCGNRIKREKCKCGHYIKQEDTAEEKAWFRRVSYGDWW